LQPVRAAFAVRVVLLPLFALKAHL